MNVIRILLIQLFVSVISLASAQKLSTGPQVLTFFSSSDDTEQPYGLYLPKSFDENRSYPLVIMLHGAGSNHRLALRRVFGKSNANGESDVEATLNFPQWKDVEYIVASPFARGTMGYQGIAEKDVYDVLADVKKRFKIDEDRTYLTGLSMGGGGTLWIGLTRPDIWAALAPVCPAPPRGSEYLAENAMNVPMHFFHGDADRAVPVAVSRDWTKRIKEAGSTVEYDEYPGVEHNSWENAYKDEAIFTWFDKFKRNKYPDQVKFNTLNYLYPKAYWVTIDKMTPGTQASINAKFTNDNQLDITTSNIKGFSLRLAEHPKYKVDQPLTVSVNGKKIKATPSDEVSFSLVNEKWINHKTQPAASGKKPGSEGPIFSAFSDRHIYVYGTLDNPGTDELKKRTSIAESAGNWSVYRNSFLGRIMFFPRVISDKEVRPSDLENSNLILFGTKETNAVIAKFADKLPLHIKSTANDMGLFYCYPVNGRYVVINSGLPWWTSGGDGGFSFTPPAVASLPSFKDFILFKGNTKNVLTEGFFNNDWKLAPEQTKLFKDNGVDYQPEQLQR